MLTLVLRRTKERTQRYKEEFQRQQSRQSAGNFQEFIDSLELVADLRELCDEDLPRASQLTMRTNQFNFTTIRRTEGELKALMNDESYSCYTMRVSDRFGDYGLVGFMVGHVDVAALQVDTFLLSCRVLGRGVEHRMVAELGKFAVERGLPAVRWKHIPTERNTPARMFLEQDLRRRDSGLEGCGYSGNSSRRSCQFQASNQRGTITIQWAG